MRDEASTWLIDLRFKASVARVVNYLIRHPKEQKRLFKKMASERDEHETR